MAIGATARGKTLGLLVMAASADRLRNTANVVICAREPSRVKAQAEGWATAPRKEAFFESSDGCTYVSPKRPDTSSRGSDLARMKPTALIINTSRAPVIEPGALAAALSGRPGTAAVDVYEEKSMHETRNALLPMDNVICTPHILLLTSSARGQQPLRVVGMRFFDDAIRSAIQTDACNACFARGPSVARVRSVSKQRVLNVLFANSPLGDHWL